MYSFLPVIYLLIFCIFALHSPHSKYFFVKPDYWKIGQRSYHFYSSMTSSQIYPIYVRLWVMKLFISICISAHVSIFDNFWFMSSVISGCPDNGNVGLLWLISGIQTKSQQSCGNISQHCFVRAKLKHDTSSCLIHTSVC